MMRVLTAYALDPDDIEGAVSGILEQLDLEKTLLKNTTGFLFCYLDFIETGLVKALCSRLPFEVIGCTTQGIALPQVSGDIILALMVLTSDNVEFRTGLSQSLEADGEERLGTFYWEMRTPVAADPSLYFAFFPDIPSFTGDRIVEILDRLSGGVHLFGSVAVDLDHGSPMVIYNGEAYQDRICLMMPSAIAPRFFIDSVIKHGIFFQRAHITSAKGNRLISINNIPAVEYMKEIGIIKKDIVAAPVAFPIMADPCDGTEPKLLIFSKLDSDGSMICISNVPADCSLVIGFPTDDMVLKTAQDLANAVIRSEPLQNGALFFSCFSRNMALSDPESEMESIRKCMEGSSLPFLFIYSGGEICPWKKDDGGGLLNNFNIYALVACTF
jgi:hypothetical protein